MAGGGLFNMSFGGWSIGENTFNEICKVAKHSILELGSGSASEALAAKFTLLSIEDNLEYVNKYKGGTVIHVPLVGSWYDVHRLADVLYFTNYNYDFIIVDAPAGSFSRLGFLFNYWIFKKVPFVIDDTNREWEGMMVRYFQQLGMKSKVIEEIDKQATLLWED